MNRRPFGGHGVAELGWLAAHGAEAGTQTRDRADLARLPLPLNSRRSAAKSATSPGPCPVPGW